MAGERLELGCNGQRDTGSAMTCGSVAPGKSQPNVVMTAISAFHAAVGRGTVKPSVQGNRVTTPGRL
jgi:hypothetical protein